MAQLNSSQMPETRAVPIPPSDMRQMEVLLAELEETRRQKVEMEGLVAALQEENGQYRDASRAQDSGRANDRVKQLEAECGKLQMAYQVFAAKNEYLEAELKRSKEKWAAERTLNNELITKIALLEPRSQENARVPQRLARQTENKNYRTPRDLDTEIDTEIEREVNTRHQSTQRAVHPNAETATTHREQEQMQQPMATNGHGLRKADWKFWSTEDEFSGAEVVFAVERLNWEILQVAAGLADELDPEHLTRGEYGSGGTMEAIKRTTNIIGPKLASMLATSNGQYATVILQTAFHTTLALKVGHIIFSWFIRDPETDRMLYDIHERLYKSEPQSVSGRWRQLTRSHLRRVERLDEHGLLPILKESLVDVVIATGYKLDQLVVEQRVKRFSNRLCEILKLALEAKRMIKEGVISCNLDMTFVPYDSPYDPDYMESVYGETSPKLGTETVVCTVDLGLVRKERVSKPEAETKEHVILKPKVVLLSTMCEQRHRSQPDE